MKDTQTVRRMQENRDRVIVKTSIVGILTNVLLAVFKAVVGIVSNSIAVVLDAVNNLTDAVSSVITIVGVKLAGKKPDKAHPFGYGRMEYLSAMMIAALVLYAGVTSAVESVKKIVVPEKPAYGAVAMLIIAAAVGVKFVLGRYVRRTGERVHSGSLVASGKDASFDAVVSASVFLSAVLYQLTGISLEAWVGAVIAGIIIKSGIEMILETVGQMLGSRADRDLTGKIKKAVCEVPQVNGAYDLVLHNYGPERFVGSVHIGVLDTMTAEELDNLEREISRKIFCEFNVLLTGISIYSINTKNDQAKEMRTRVTDLVMKHDNVLEMHGFYVNLQTKALHFDIVVDFAAENRQALAEQIRQEAQSAYPDFQVEMTADTDV